MSSGKEKFDEEIIWRCPKLGGSVPFKYCRTLTGGYPCVRIINCWGQTMEIEKFLDSEYGMEELQAKWAEQPKKNKMSELIRLVNEAKKSEEESASE